MNIRISILVFIVVFVIDVHVEAQNTYKIGTLPAVNINKGLKQGYRLNFKWESRQLLAEGDFESGQNACFEYVLSDFGLMASKKTGLNNSIAGGYLLRVRNGDVLHRAIQQFTIVKKHNRFRLAYRLSMDQTFKTKELPVFRMRGRITAEIPLNGEAADPGEFYVKLNNEYLNVFEENGYNLEIRIVPLLGYGFTDNNKLEMGLDYRAGSFLEGGSENSFWININWFVKI